jgi:uncharacterized protein involved in outer membrane biogenesis
MADTNVSSPAPKKRRSWLRLLLGIIAVLVVLLVVVYFVATSSAFLKGVILPRASKAMNANITVSDASISPFSQVILRDLKVQTTGTEPLVSAQEARLRYSLMSIIRGKINVDEIAVVSPRVVLVQNPDGTSNLDPITKAQQAQPQAAKPAPAKPSPPSKPLQVDIRKIVFSDVTLRNVKLYKNGGSDVAEISHLNVSLDNVKNGQTGKFTVSADLGMTNNPPAPAPAGLLAAKVNGSYDFSLSPDLKPASVKGNTHLGITRAEGALAQAASLSGDLDCDLSSTDIKQVALRFQRGNTQLGQVRLSGPFDMEKVEGKLLVELLGVDKQLLNLAGASSALDFGPTTINSTNTLQVAKGGTSVSLDGQFNINQLQVTRTNQTTPPLDLRADYSLAVDTAQSNLKVQQLAINGAEKGRPIVHGGLTSPMQISWGNTANAIGDSTLNVVVTNFDLGDWSAFAGDAAPAGLLNAQMNLLSQQAGKQLTFSLNTKLDKLSAGSGSNRISEITITFQMNGKAAELKQYSLTGYQLEVAQRNQTMVTSSGSGTYDQATQAADMQLSANLNLPHLMQALQRSDINASSGEVQLTAHLTQKDKNQSVKAALQMTNLVVNDPSGRIPATPLQAGLQLDASMNGNVADLRQCQLSLTPTPRATNQLQLTGHVDMSQSNAITGTLTLAADSLDVSTYYDLFASQKPAPAKPAAPANPSTPVSTTAASSGQGKEPDAMHLPVRNFTANANIHHFYLHELEIADLQANTKIDDAHIVLNPAKLTLNGAPVSATIDTDLGVPGWKYSVAFNGQAVPLAPMVNSFLPDRKGILSGTLTAQGNVDGAGTTGASLQKYLAAQLDVTSTNLNLSVDNIQGKNATTRLMKLLLDTISSIPELVKGQASLGSLFSGTSGSGSSGGNPTSTIKKSPINSIILHGKAGSGRVDLQEATIQSPAFQSQVTGTVTLAAVLTNSTLQLPVSVWLERSVAEQIHLAGDTSTNETYAKLPDFLTFTGTVGNAKPNYNYGVLTKAALQAFGGKSGQAGNALQNLGNMLGGGSSTNASGTNQKANLMKGLGSLLGGSSSTTNSSATNKPNLGGLKNLFK